MLVGQQMLLESILYQTRNPGGERGGAEQVGRVGSSAPGGAGPQDGWPCICWVSSCCNAMYDVPSILGRYMNLQSAYIVTVCYV